MPQVKQRITRYFQGKNATLKGSVSRDFLPPFFHDSNPSRPLINRLKYFRILFRFRRNIILRDQLLIYVVKYRAKLIFGQVYFRCRLYTVGQSRQISGVAYPTVHEYFSFCLTGSPCIYQVLSNNNNK